MYWKEREIVTKVGYMTKHHMFRAQILLKPWKFYMTAVRHGRDS